jgi:RHS repeat-associated protein
VDFNYGPDRKRWSQTYYNISAGSYETTDYLGGLFEQVIGSAITGTIYRYYIYAGSEPIAVYARTSGGTNTFSYMLSDHQGSVSDLTSSTGTSTVNESFTPYGLRRNPATWSGAASNSDLTTAAGITRQAYTFQTQMGLWMGLNHMNGRVQDSMIGRFLSADPHITDPTNTQSYNRYSYAINNPLTRVDPTGFEDEDDIDDTGGAWGGGGGVSAGSDGSDGPPLPENVATGHLPVDPLTQILFPGDISQIVYEPPLQEIVATGTKPKPQGNPKNPFKQAFCSFINNYAQGSAGFEIGDGFGVSVNLSFTNHGISLFIGAGLGVGVGWFASGGATVGVSTGAAAGLRGFVSGSVAPPTGGPAAFVDASAGTDGVDASAGVGRGEGAGIVSGLGVNVNIADAQQAQNLCSS